jgi:hypothetical protein
MKRFLLFSVLVFAAMCGNSQSLKEWSTTAKIGNGFIVAHRPSVVHVLQKHCRSLELNFTQTTTKRKGWEELYNFPEIGFGYQYFNLGNPQELGSAQGLFGLIKFKLINHKTNFLKTHLGFGVGYVSKPFNVEDNYKNLLVGSRINATITTGIEYQIRLSKKSEIISGINLTHYSNGGSNVPNMGINLAMLNIGLIYHLNEIYPIEKDTVNIDRAKSFEVLLAGGVTQIYPPNSPKYGVGIITADYLWPLKKKSVFTIGADAFVDGSHKKFLLQDSIITDGFESAVRGGIHFGIGIQVGKCTGLLQTGYYFYNPYEIDGRIYNTLSFRYHLNNQWFVCFNLKSHYARADYFQYGIGYHL